MILPFLAIIVGFLFSFSSSVNGHSWLECTDYRGNLVDYQEDQCFGRPRQWWNLTQYCPDIFGTDCGYNWTPSGTGGNQCIAEPRHPLGSDYPPQAPMAIYNFGQLVTLAWPAKSHVAADCTTPDVNDEGLKVFFSQVDPSRDPTREEFAQREHRASFSDDPHVNGVIDFKGYQNCPNFCVNQDKALCTGHFLIDDAFVPGTYTFQWFWESYPNEFYSTCWEGRIRPEGYEKPKSKY